VSSDLCRVSRLFEDSLGERVGCAQADSPAGRLHAMWPAIPPREGDDKSHLTENGGREIRHKGVIMSASQNVETTKKGYAA
jgi:hypothetical protein